MYLISVNDKFGQVMWKSQLMRLYKANTFWAKAEIWFSVLSPKRQGPSELQGILNCIYCTGSADWLPHPSTGLKMFWTKYWFIGTSMWFCSVSWPTNYLVNFTNFLSTSMWFWSVSWLKIVRSISQFFLVGQKNWPTQRPDSFLSTLLIGQKNCSVTETGKFFWPDQEKR